MIRLNEQQYWLYAAADPATNRLLHITLTPTRTMALPSMFLAEQQENLHVNDAAFLVDSAPWMQADLERDGLRFQYDRHGNQNSLKRVFRELKRRTASFANT